MRTNIYELRFHFVEEEPFFFVLTSTTDGNRQALGSVGYSDGYRIMIELDTISTRDN